MEGGRRRGLGHGWHIAGAHSCRVEVHWAHTCDGQLRRPDTNERADYSMWTGPNQRCRLLGKLSGCMFGSMYTRIAPSRGKLWCGQRQDELLVMGRAQSPVVKRAGGRANDVCAASAPPTTESLPNYRASAYVHTLRTCTRDMSA